MTAHTDSQSATDKKDSDTFTVILAMLLSAALTTAAIKLLFLDPLSNKVAQIESASEGPEFRVLNSMTIRPDDLGSDEGDITGYFKKVQEYTRHLSAKGILVIEAKSLYRYPESLEIRPEHIHSYFKRKGE